MATIPDLAKPRIDRDAPPPAVKRAFTRALWLVGATLGGGGGIGLWLRRGSAVPVQVVTVAAGETAGVGGGGGPVGVVANGYVVARTKAAVSAKIPGRLAFLAVSEGSFVHQRDVIARLDNADYAAAVGEAEAQVASARATLIELEADRDQLRRDFARVRDLHTQNPNLVSQQEVEAADSRSRQGDARAGAQAARVEAAAAGLRLAQANFENTLIRAPFTGTVLRKEAEVGEVVAPSPHAGSWCRRPPSAPRTAVPSCGSYGAAAWRKGTLTLARSVVTCARSVPGFPGASCCSWAGSRARAQGSACG